MCRKISHYLYSAMLMISLLLLVSSPVGAEGPVVEEFSVEPGDKLVFDLSAGGDVRVTGWDQDQARISYTQRGRGEVQQVDIREISDGIRISSQADDGDRSTKALAFDIRVPQEFDIEFSSMGGGLDLRGLEGEFSGETMGGHLNLVNVTGKVRLTTMGGRIQVQDSELDGFLKTMGGGGAPGGCSGRS